MYSKSSPIQESEIRLLMAIACSIVATGKISLYPCNSKSSVSKGLVSPCLHSFDMMDDRGSTNGNESNAPMVRKTLDMIRVNWTGLQTDLTIPWLSYYCCCWT